MANAVGVRALINTGTDVDEAENQDLYAFQGVHQTHPQVQYLLSCKWISLHEQWPIRHNAKLNLNLAGDPQHRTESHARPSSFESFNARRWESEYFRF